MARRPDQRGPGGGERRGGRWLALLVGAVAIGSLLSAVPVAAAATVSAARPADSIPAEVAAYEERFGVPAEVAEESLAIQRRGAGIVDQLESLLGAEFAGVWFDNEAGEFVVPLLPDSNRSGVETSLDHAYLAGDFRIDPVEHSMAALDAAQERLDKSLAGLLTAQLAQTSVDPRVNAVVIHLAEEAGGPARSEAEALAAAEKVNVAIRTEPVKRFEAKAFACVQSPRVCDKPLRSGVYIDWAGTHAQSCTAGFKALGNVYGNRFVLTAGHCYAGSADWASRESGNFSYYLGHGEEGAYPGGDYAKIRVNGYSTYWDETPWTTKVVYWGGSQNLPINYESSSYLGQSVCYSGSASGSACGFVNGVDKTANYGDGNVYHLTDAGLNATQGDSGGPVWAGETALGLVSGGIEGYGVTYYSEVTEATAAMGVSVGGKVGAPPFAETKPAENVQGWQVTGAGKVDPNGLATTYRFEYGPTTSLGSSTQSWSAGSGWGTGEVAQAFSVQPLTSYYYRLSASNGAGASYGGIYSFTTPAGAPLVTTEGTTGVGGGVATLRGKVNPGGASTSYYFEWGPTAAYGSKSSIGSAGSGVAEVAVSQAIGGLKGQTTYHYRLVAENSKGKTTGADASFTTPDWRPQATTEGAAGVSGGKATLNGTVNPKSLATSYQFEWGPTAAYGSKVPVPAASAGSGEANVKVSKAIEGLKGQTGYHYRLVASNSEGTAYGQDKELTTPDWRPVVTPLAAQGVAASKATLKAKVNPGSLATTYQFEYGPTTAYGSEAPASPKAIGSGSAEVEASETAQGLTPETTYHFRAVAVNAEGTVYGKDEAFTTPAAAITLPASKVRQNDAALNATVDPTGQETSYRFEFGATTAYGTSVPASPKAIGSGTDAVAVSEAVEGLEPSTRYHYRVAATSGKGTAYGKDASFKTFGSPAYASSFGAQGSGNGQFNVATDVAVDPTDGSVWVADDENDRIQHFSAAGAYLSQFKSCQDPGAVEVDAKGDVYVACSSVNSVVEYGDKGEVLRQVAGYGAGNGQVSFPLDLALDSEENLWIADTANDRVEKLSPSGAFLQAIPLGTWGRPWGVDVAPNGNVWVAEKVNQRVSVFSPQGALLFRFGSAGSGPGQFERPVDVEVDDNGYAWVGDAVNDRVQVFGKAGEYVTQFGAKGSGAGQLDTDWWLRIGIGSGGDVWVVDQGNWRVQRWDAL